MQGRVVRRGTAVGDGFLPELVGSLGYGCCGERHARGGEAPVQFGGKNPAAGIVQVHTGFARSALPVYTTAGLHCYARSRGNRVCHGPTFTKSGLGFSVQPG